MIVVTRTEGNEGCNVDICVSRGCHIAMTPCAGSNAFETDLFLRKSGVSDARGVRTARCALFRDGDQSAFLEKMVREFAQRPAFSAVDVLSVFVSPGVVPVERGSSDVRSELGFCHPPLDVPQDFGDVWFVLCA